MSWNNRRANGNYRRIDKAFALFPVYLPVSSEPNAPRKLKWFVTYYVELELIQAGEYSYWKARNWSTKTEYEACQIFQKERDDD